MRSMALLFLAALNLTTLYATANITNPQESIATVESPKVTAEAANLNPEDQWTPNLGKGHWTVGGNFGVLYSTYSSATYFVNPEAEYFATDRLSLGGTLNASTWSSGSSIGLGPSFSYYVLKSDRWASSIGGSLVYSRDNWGSSTDRQWTANGRIGLEYFLTPSVSFGPRVQVSRVLNQSELGLPSTQTSALFQFSIHL